MTCLPQKPSLTVNHSHLCLTHAATTANASHASACSQHMTKLEYFSSKIIGSYKQCMECLQLQIPAGIHTCISPMFEMMSDGTAHCNLICHWMTKPATSPYKDVKPGPSFSLSKHLPASRVQMVFNVMMAGLLAMKLAWSCFRYLAISFHTVRTTKGWVWQQHGVAAVSLHMAHGDIRQHSFRLQSAKPASNTL
jgi:hypothetical protein